MNPSFFRFGFLHVFNFLTHFGLAARALALRFFILPPRFLLGNHPSTIGVEVPANPDIEESS